MARKKRKRKVREQLTTRILGLFQKSRCMRIVTGKKKPERCHRAQPGVGKKVERGKKKGKDYLGEK